MALNRLSPNTAMSEWLLMSRSSVSHQLMWGGGLGGGYVPYVSLTSETIPLWELRQALLHSLSTHPTWAQPQWGKATQVSHRVSTPPTERGNINPVISQAAFQLLPALLLRCVADGCPEAFVTNASMKKHMARVHQKKKPYQARRFWHFYPSVLSLPFNLFLLV